MKIQLKSNLDFLNLHTYPKINIKMKVTPSQWGFPSSSDGKAPACNAGDRGLILGQEDPLEKETATQSSILAW